MAHWKARSCLPVSNKLCFSLGVTAKSENRLKIGIFEETGPVWTKMSGIRGHPASSVLRVGKPVWSISHVVSYKILAEISFVYHNSRIWQTNGETDISLVANTALHTPSSIKTGHYIIGDNSVKCESIFTIFAPLGRELNFQQNPSNTPHFTLTLVSHYFGKFKILIYLKNQSTCTLCSILWAEYIVCK